MKLMHTRERRAAVALIAASFAAACEGTSVPTTASSDASRLSSPTPITLTTGTAASACATGDGVNDGCACDADAHAYCEGFYSADWPSYARANGYTTASWKYGLIDCLRKQPVAAACTTSLDRRETLNAQMMNACATYCRGTKPQPGSEPCVDRLKSIYESLDQTCRVALDAHEVAKPLDLRRPL
jgi:hypothetical protein